jgi:putative ATP-dependent endonuclease of the OLD family
MRLDRVTVHNFRGVREESFTVLNYTLLVGANNGGKSTIIDAIRAFYEKDNYKYRRDRDWPMIATADKDSWVELTFICTDEEYASLAENYRIGANALVVRKYFEVEDRGKTSRIKAGCIYGMQPDGTFSEDQFYGAKNVQQGKLGEIIYIPAVSRVDEHTKLSGPSALRDLLSNILDDVVESSTAFSRLKEDFAEFAETIKSEKTEGGRSLDQFESELSDHLSSWNTTFRINIDSPRPADIIKNLMRYECIDGAIQRPQCADDFGSGFQRHFIFSLIRIAPRYVAAHSKRKSKDFSPDFTLILFEEPEAFLHPPQQEVLASSLRELTADDTRQVICTTHSSHFVSKNAGHIPAIVRLERSDGLVTLRQVSDADWQQIVSVNQALNQLPSLKRKVETDDLRPEMEALKYFLWLNADRCTLFFANHVILVEGAADQAFLNRLIKDGRLGDEQVGIYVLDCLGKHNIHRFMSLLIKLGIRHSVLHDEDEPSAEHEEINELIRATAHRGLTLEITAIPKNLEVMLGVPKCKGPHRKPQHLMYYYETGQIGQNELDSFCELVAKCIPVQENLPISEAMKTNEEAMTQTIISAD